jgi:hypothetical protein
LEVLKLNVIVPTTFTGTFESSVGVNLQLRAAETAASLNRG